jgi:hypothetical protein
VSPEELQRRHANERQALQRQERRERR